MIMAKYYIVRGRAGLVISSQEPATWEDRVEGPFTDHLEAFDRMEELSALANRKRALVEVAALLLAIGAGLGTLNAVAG